MTSSSQQATLSVDITSNFTIPSTYKNERETQFFETYKAPSFSVSLFSTTNNNNNSNVLDAQMKIIDEPYLFQIILIEDINKPLLQQFDDLSTEIDPKKQKVDRISTSSNPNNKEKKNNLVTSINVDVDVDNNNNNNHSDSDINNKIYKLTIQDKSGKMYFAFNIDYIPFCKNMLNPLLSPKPRLLGTKIIILPGAIFNRGVFILNNANVKFLGGAIKEWNHNIEGKMIYYWKAKLQQLHEQQLNSKKKKITETF
ncbi:Rmi1p SCDLUD_001943 [Saccharomycodes ludwigii]|uniref:Rmi1p n=1 Tax=Saccharomycodes ludwigii TaxID=36035 RepID=UPI001E89AB47|nr:hypothetical protein SCDLUD_001943 [Saccharomycodes ludwigii]KAH3902130.1 hypothetical protein SCDLUD_001943 [Saccharomycodes ludwigii]